MDLFSTLGSIWRHKLVTIPVILLTVLGVFYVLAIKPPVYEASSSFMLVNPPNPPTAAQIAADPALAKINTNNPYVNFGDLTYVADALINLSTSDTAQQALIQAGAHRGYQIALSSDYGSPPIIEITGVGSSAQEAIRSTNLVTSLAKVDLYQMQKEQHVKPLYMINPVQLVTPVTAHLTQSGKLRTVAAVFGLGILVLFLAISVVDVIEKRGIDGPFNADKPARARADKAQRVRAGQPKVASPREGNVVWRQTETRH